MDLKTGIEDKTVLRETARALAEALNAADIGRNFITAMDTANHNPEVKRLLPLIRDRQSGKFAVQDDGPSLAQLQAELEALPEVVAFHQAEREMCNLLSTVDDVISQAAGVPFAANARRSCCG